MALCQGRVSVIYLLTRGVLFHWDLLIGTLPLNTLSTLLKEFAQLSLTIWVHAFTSMVLEEYKHEKQVTMANAKVLRATLKKHDCTETD